jgi:hypothetical protein
MPSPLVANDRDIGDRGYPQVRSYSSTSAPLGRRQTAARLPQITYAGVLGDYVDVPSSKAKASHARERKDRPTKETQLCNRARSAMSASVRPPTPLTLLTHRKGRQRGTDPEPSERGGPIVEVDERPAPRNRTESRHYENVMSTTQSSRKMLPKELAAQLALGRKQAGSWRNVAERCEISTGYLGELCKGTRAPRRAVAERLIEGLRLPEATAEQLLRHVAPPSRYRR